MGYFVPINKHNNFLNIYGGIGVGKNHINDLVIDSSASVYSNFHNSRMIKFYLQPGFTFFSEKKLSSVVATKFSFIKYSGIITDYTTQKLEEFYFHQLSDRVLVLLEPTFSIQIPFSKLEWFKIKANLTCSIPISEFDAMYYRIFYGSFGFSLDFTKMKKK